MRKIIAILLSVSMLLCMLTPVALAESETVITLNGDHATINGSGATSSGSVVTIAAAGVYVITGTLNDGQLIVDAGKKDDITLILRNAEISNASEAALLISKADKVTLQLEAGTTSKLVSGTAFTITAATSSDEEVSGAALHAKCDLTITGTGTLFVGGYVHQGIRVTKDLRIEGGQLAVEAAATGIRCKDKLEISGGILGIVSGSNGIHAASEATEEAAADGHSVISGGTIHVTSFGDAIQSETTLEISGGSVSLLSGGGAENAPAHADDFDFMRGGWFGREQSAAQSVNENTGMSSKGLKSAGNMLISGGELNINACDDALCSRGDLLVTGGTINAATGDDGLHADNSLEITGGSISVTQSYEGLEGATITISDGTVSIVSTDDGINASNGSSDMLGFGRGGFGGMQGDGFDRGGFGRGGQMGRGGSMPGPGNGNQSEPPQKPDGMPADGTAPSDLPAPDSINMEEPESQTTSLPSLLISGGSVYVNAQGDGLDSNGNLLITGGLVIVDGPDNSMNGALDSGTESGGYLRVTGGTVLAIGAAGMNESFDSSSEQAVLNASARWNPGDEIVIADANGNVLIRHTAVRSGQSIIYSDASLVNGTVMTVTAGSTSTEATVGAASSYGSWGGFGGGHGGRR